MRELRLLAALAFATVLGIGAAFVFAPKAAVTEATLNVEAVSSVMDYSSSTVAVTRIVEPDSSDVLPVATYQWSGPEKESAIQRVERLKPFEAECLCFTLNLISRDEVFDKVNAKGRLMRYVEARSGPSDLRDFENAFWQMAMR